jgi:hypothetical protein
MDRRRQLIEAILRPSAPKPGGPILDLSQVPSPDAQAGLLSGMLQNYQPGMADYARDAEGVARSAATAAPEAIVRAYEDPNAATISSAAGQTALTFGKPLQAVGIAGMGLLGSLLDDAGAFDTQAQADEIDPLGSSRKRFDQLQAKQAKGAKLSRAEREEQNTYLGIIGEAQKAKVAAETAKQSAADAAAQKEYSGKVDKAMDVREEELARDVRFSDTETGKWYKENATWLPFAAAYGGGMLSRLATGPGKSTTGKAIKEWILPTVGGTTASFGAQNAPEIYDMKQTPSLNPEREAYRKAALELPEGHPDKQKWTDYAASLDVENPVKKAATETLQNNLGMTGLTALAEGFSLGKFGAGTVNLPRRLANDAADGFSNFRSRAGGAADEATSRGGTGAGPQQTGPSGAGQNSQTYRTYNDLPPNVRQDARDAYVVDRTLSGGSPSPKAAADGYRKVFSDNGINVPVTPARIKATNDAVSRFVQANGREPMGPADWSKIFNDKTLLVALGAGVGAGTMSGGSGEAEAADPQRAMLVDLIRRVQAGEI